VSCFVFVVLLFIIYIFCSFAILFESDGWVWKNSFVLVGFAMKSGAIAPEVLSGVELCWIFLSAPISPVGVLINFTADESAAYSRCLEIASWTSAVIIGARIARAIPIAIRTALLLLFSRSPRTEDQNRFLRNSSDIIAIMPIRTDVSVMNRMS